MPNDAKLVAKLLLDTGSVSINIKKPFKYASGILSPIYCDNRLLISDVKRRKKVLELWAKMLKSKKLEFNTVAGTAMAGIPHAAWLSDMLNLPMIYVRTENKGHGKRNKIEGKLEENANVLVVDDLFSTGGSCINSVTSIREAGATVTNATAIFSYQLETAKQNFQQAKCNMHPLSTFDVLIDLAVTEKKITKQEAKIALEWSQNPAKWGEKHANAIP